MRQLLVLFGLLAIFAGTGELASRVAPNVEFDANTLTATGFILLAAYAFGELFRRFRLPALLGYLAAGMLFGPSASSLLLGDPVLAPIGSHALGQLGLVNMLAVGVIGTMGGGELKIEDIRGGFRKIASITGVVFVTVLPIVAVLVLGLSFFAPSLIPFLADVPLAGRIAAALLFGTLAVGMSPSATLALLLEVRAHGRFTSLMLGVVVLADLVLVATFLVMLALSQLLLSPDGFSAAGLFAVLPTIAAEFGWAIVLGLAVGAAFIAYLRLVGRELLLFSLGVIFITSFVASRLHAETLLAFLVGGFVVQNFSRHGHTLIEAFERIALPVFVIYFTTQAATLDLVAFTTYLPLTLLLVVTRLSLFYYGINGAARLVGVDDQQRRLLRISFFSQGGVDLVLAAMIADAIPGLGAEIRTVTIATILIYVVLGPPLLARALDEAGESAAARERGAETLHARRVRLETPSARANFPGLQTGSSDLDHRLEILRRLVASSSRDLAHEVAVASRRRRETIEQLSLRMARLLDPATRGGGSVDEPVVDGEALERDLNDLQAAIADASRSWTDADIAPLRAERVRSVLESFRLAVPFGASYRLLREDALFAPRGGALQRAVRFARRARRALLGPGHRAVPLGKLWRFHVALEVPIALWSNPHGDEREAWAKLLSHYRLTCRAVQQVLSGQRASPRDSGHSLSGSHPSLSGPQAVKSGAHATRTGPHASIDGHEPAGAASSARDPFDLLAEAHAAATERTSTLVAELQNYDALVNRHLEAAFEVAWRAFLESVELAGTLEYPAWRYRVSARYDASKAASAELLERLERDAAAAGALRDVLSALANAAHVRTEAGPSIKRAADRLTAEVRVCVPRIAAALEECAQLGAATEDHERDRSVAAGLASTTTDLATAIDRVARRLERADATGAQVNELDALIAAVPAMLHPVPLSRAEDSAQRIAERRIPVPLRAWLDRAIGRRLTVAMLDIRAELVQAVGAVAGLLHQAGQVLEYHLVTAPPDTDVDARVGERVSGILTRARAELEGALATVGSELERHLAAATEAGVAPVLQGRWDEIQRQARRADERVVSRAALAAVLRDRVRSSLVRLGASLHRLRDEIAAVFTDRTTDKELAAYRRMLFGPASTMPEAYQRLFTSVPAENVGLVLERRQSEPVLAGIDRWLEGGGGPILVRGDRGVGKRTLIRALEPKVASRLKVRWLRLSPELESEADVCRALSQLTEVATCDDFAALERALRARARFQRSGEPTAIVVANVERIFRRTAVGLDRIRRVFDLIATTSREILWIVLFGEPAARLLGPVLELEGRFPVIVRVPPMNAAELEAALGMRHRLSGYELRFEQHVPSLHEWVRNPVSAWRARRSAERSAFERLRVLSGGNPRQAQRLWLAAARPDPDHEGGVVVGPLDAMADSLLDGLPLVSRVLLAAILLHGPLRRRELTEVVLREGHALDAEVTHLVHLGFLTMHRRALTGWDDEDDVLIEVSTRLGAPLAEELRACNLL